MEDPFPMPMFVLRFSEVLCANLDFEEIMGQAGPDL